MRESQKEGMARGAARVPKAPSLAPAVPKGSYMIFNKSLKNREWNEFFLFDAKRGSNVIRQRRNTAPNSLIPKLK
jgi:hypothetical protein